MGNGCTAKTFGNPFVPLTLRPFAATVAVVVLVVLFHLFPRGLRTRLVLIQLVSLLFK
jgi:hypothetical protein